MEDWRLLITSYQNESFLKQVNDGMKLLNKKLGWKEYPHLGSLNTGEQNNE